VRLGDGPTHDPGFARYNGAGEVQGLATRNAYANELFMLVFHALGRFLGSPNPVCPSMTEWFGRRYGLQEGNRLQDKS
jgi:hypothetical protein